LKDANLEVTVNVNDVLERALRKSASEIEDLKKENGELKRFITTRYPEIPIAFKDSKIYVELKDFALYATDGNFRVDINGKEFPFLNGLSLNFKPCEPVFITAKIMGIPIKSAVMEAREGK